MQDIKQFINPGQLSSIRSNQSGEEGQYFIDLEAHIQEVINVMPKTYETDGQGDEAIAYLHYFVGGFDWYVTERDMYDRQQQAFGLVKMQCTELGYISIVDLMENNVELDMHWTPTRIGDLK